MAIDAKPFKFLGYDYGSQFSKKELIRELNKVSPSFQLPFPSRCSHICFRLTAASALLASKKVVNFFLLRLEIGDAVGTVVIVSLKV